jgi:CDP-paratose 2-epimerase
VSETRNGGPQLGILEWFRLWEEERVERAIADMRALGVTTLRTGFSWADWMTPQGDAWYAWLLPRLAKEFDVLPCFLYTPPSLGVAPKASAPPKNPRDYADWLDVVVERYGKHFEYVELWNEPNNTSEWDWTLDFEWHAFSAMVGGAAHWMKQRGKKTVLGGMSPIDPNWIELMAERRVLDYIDVIGVHGFPGAWTASWLGWHEEVQKVRRVLDARNWNGEIWITETGHSTWRNDAFGQTEALLTALEAPVERVYWYGLTDLRPELSANDGFHVDERDYHFGLMTHDGQPKTLYRLWQSGGMELVREMKRLTPHVASNEPVTLITGGSGFVGVNVADKELADGKRVRLFDNLSRPGVEHNFKWLKAKYGDQVELHVGDVRDKWSVRQAVQGVERAYHFAAQVAVTTSVDRPVNDFDINAVGTINLLEELRALPSPPALLFTSTNKVYGDLEDVALRLKGDRYEPQDLLIRSSGISEDRPLDFHSPYGCSKGTADQYVLDYGRTYGLPTVVFRMSCIYGPHQFGNEDQGWVAHFLIRALMDEPITLYGDGKQVRDVLFVEDLVAAMQLAHEQISVTKGHAFNIGGGPENTTSLLELLDLIGDLTDAPVQRGFSDWRVGDQRYYVSDTTRFKKLTGWNPQVNVRTGVERLSQWLIEESPTVRARRQLVAREEEYVRNVTVR